jgi:hypothetical protein
MSPSDDDIQAMGDEAGELTRRIALLDDDLEQIGLYTTNKTVAAQRSGGDTILAAVVTALIGKVAFSERVQHPERWADHATFDDLIESDVLNEYERRKSHLRELHRGDDPLGSGGDAAEGDG